MFPDRQQRGFQLIQVGHRFKKDQVGAGLDAGFHHLGKLVHRVLERQGAGRGQQLPQRAHIQSHQRAGLVGGGAGAGDGGRNHLVHRASGAGQLARVGAKGVGAQDLGPGLGVVPVDGGESLRHGQCGKLRLLAGLQAAGGQLGAHAAVQKDKAAAGKNISQLHRWSPFFDRRSRRAARRWRSRPLRR